MLAGRGPASAWLAMPARGDVPPDPQGDQDRVVGGTPGKPASPRDPGVKPLAGGSHYLDAYAAQPSNPAKEEVTVVVSAANSAARKRSRPSGSTGRDSRGPERVPEVVPEQSAQPAPPLRGTAGRRPGGASEDLATVSADSVNGADLSVVGLEARSEERR